ncbi:hypothetical protein GCM10009069_29520 [Algimonas arctica]|uniref:Uncharacterized protein n=1 Tax=Algimonas arctica TaxID=1479486 RepID=A0A8J3G3R3_9PROT|nr:hypothetical protein [Algimonas arctica]GHB05101.1 hypothetical protein GCM10009069_29520 [Algimonas arctica]
MKPTVAIFAILLTGLTSSFARAQSTPGWGRDVPYPDPPPGIVALTQQQADSVKDRVCTALHQSGNTENFSISETVEGIIFFYMGIKGDTPGNRKLLAESWNFYAPMFVCQATSGIYPTQHVYKRAIELSVYDEFIVDWLLSDPEGFLIDISVVEIALDGTGSTLLDYIDMIQARSDAKEIYDLGQLIRLRRIVESRFNGKRLHEMGPCERERRMSRVIRDAYLPSVEDCVPLSSGRP